MVAKFPSSRKLIDVLTNQIYFGQISEEGQCKAILWQDNIVLIDEIEKICSFRGWNIDDYQLRDREVSSI